jgi:hypothetical protein
MWLSCFFLERGSEVGELTIQGSSKMDLRSEDLPAKPAVRDFDTNQCPSILAYPLIMTTNDQSCHSNSNAPEAHFKSAMISRFEFILTVPMTMMYRSHPVQRLLPCCIIGY